MKKEGRQEDCREKYVTREAQVGIMWAHETRNVGGLQELEKVEKGILP